MTDTRRSWNNVRRTSNAISKKFDECIDSLLAIDSQIITGQYTLTFLRGMDPNTIRIQIGEISREAADLINKRSTSPHHPHPVILSVTEKSTRENPINSNTHGHIQIFKNGNHTQDLRKDEKILRECYEKVTGYSSDGHVYASNLNGTTSIGNKLNRNRTTADEDNVKRQREYISKCATKDTLDSTVRSYGVCGLKAVKDKIKEKKDYDDTIISRYMR